MNVPTCTLAAGVAAVLATVAITACGQADADAYGNFEATEVTVAAEVAGRLLTFSLTEGDRVTQGTPIGTVDTTPLALERRALQARRAAGASHAREAEASIAALTAEVALAEREQARTERLLRDAAATPQQSDRAEREVRVLREQLVGARAAHATALQEVAALDAQVALLDDRLARSRVVPPQDGTVLARYVESGEYVQPGQPLFKLASLDSLTLRAYVSGAQLSTLRLGQDVTVRVDRGRDALVSLPGRVTWIASAAEFTPTPIQTRDERADQVYAIKVAVANPDGALKIGMPGELVLRPAGAGR